MHKQIACMDSCIKACMNSTDQIFQYTCKTIHTHARGFAYIHDKSMFSLVCTYLQVHAYMHSSHTACIRPMYAFMHEYIPVCMFTHVCSYMHALCHISLSLAHILCMWEYIYIYIHIYIIYIYIYMHINSKIHLYTCIYIYKQHTNVHRMELAALQDPSAHCKCMCVERE